MGTLIFCLFAIVLFFGVIGVIKFVFKNFSAILWTSILFLAIIGAVLTSIGN